MKYPIYTMDGLPTVKTFSEHLSHADEHNAFMWVHRARRGDIKLESAGFYNTYTTTRFSVYEFPFQQRRVSVEAFGHSESLNVHSRPEDASTIQMALEMESTATPRFHAHDFAVVADVNDGENPHFPQPAPKQRILAALREIKAKGAK